MMFAQIYNTNPFIKEFENEDRCKKFDLHIKELLSLYNTVTNEGCSAEAKKENIEKLTSLAISMSNTFLPIKIIKNNEVRNSTISYNYNDVIFRFQPTSSVIKSILINKWESCEKGNSLYDILKHKIGDYTFFHSFINSSFCIYDKLTEKYIVAQNEHIINALEDILNITVKVNNNKNLVKHHYNLYNKENREELIEQLKLKIELMTNDELKKLLVS